MLILNLAHWVLSIINPETYKASSLWFRVFCSAFIFSGGGTGLIISLVKTPSIMVQIILFVPPSLIVILMAFNTDDPKDLSLLIEAIK